VSAREGVGLRTGGRPPATALDAAEQVATACRILARFGHEDLTLGHASVRGPDGITIYIKRKGKALGEVLAEDVMPIRLDREDGYLAPGAHLETAMHTEAYRARPDIGAAIHTHPLHSIAVGATEQGLSSSPAHSATPYRFLGMWPTSCTPSSTRTSSLTNTGWPGVG
jgi:ribulose-5-phosphate 4-epimerase/fuculose-1-phosphate aldolase